MNRSDQAGQGISRRGFLFKGGAAALTAGVAITSWQTGFLRSIFTKGDRKGLDRAIFTAMGTYLEITLPAGLGSSPVRDAREASESVEQLMSFFLAESELSQINRHAFHRPMVLSAPMQEVIQVGERIHRLSEGAFDPTIGPLMAAWGFSGRQQTHRPGKAAVRNAMKQTGLHHVHGAGKAVRFDQEGIELDLGGIAKGYAVDQTAMTLAQKGHVGLVNAGGDIRAIGSKPDGSPWTVGVRDPHHKDRIFATIPLPKQGGAVATSGTYERHLELDGKRIPHILDPRSGEPVGAVISATVVADTAVEADAVATACVAMTPKEALSFLERLPNVEGLLVGRDSSGHHRIEATHHLNVNIRHAV